jgi:hypothetical protein
MNSSGYLRDTNASPLPGLPFRPELNSTRRLEGFPESQKWEISTDNEKKTPESGSRWVLLIVVKPAVQSGLSTDDGERARRIVCRDGYPLMMRSQLGTRDVVYFNLNV